MTGDNRNRKHRHSKIVRAIHTIKQKESDMRMIGRDHEANGLKAAADILQVEFKITDQEMKEG